MNSAQSKPTTMRRHRSQRAATDSATSATRIAQRVGFTLVELLMVILIIGILVSMLVVAVNPVLQTAREFAVTQEMKQMDLAIENFRNKNGFYPPSFVGFVRAPNMEAQLLPYLNKLSPNHQELSPMFPGVSRLRVWWNAIGCKLNDSGSLIFWLNGLSTNKQFPITGGLPLVDAMGNVVTTGGNAQLPVIFNGDFVVRVNMAGAVQTNTNGSNEFDLVGPLERESLFDFNGGQLSDQFFNPALATPGLAPTGAGIRVYNQAFGNAKFDLAYRYRNSAFYGDPQGTAGVAFHINTDGTPPQVFLNPNTFQISTLGLDGRVSTLASTAINKPTTTPSGDPPTAQQLTDWQSFNGDNIANFAAGRLDGFDWTEAVELGNSNPR